MIRRVVGTERQMTITSLNCFNINEKEIDRARKLVERLKNMNWPDTVALQEIQDNDGPIISDQTSAERTLAMFKKLILEAGGPDYESFDIAPKENNASGGEPGGNIRTCYLAKKSRVKINKELSGVIGEGDPAFHLARPPRVLCCEFAGQKTFIINNHFSSLLGSSPWNSEIDVRGREKQRKAQAEYVGRYIQYLQQQHPGAKILCLGDFNDPTGRDTIDIICKDSKMANYSRNLLDPKDYYDYNWRGKLQCLCPILGSQELLEKELIEMEIFSADTLVPIEDAGTDHSRPLIRVTY